MVIVTNSAGNEIGPVKYQKIDIDIGAENDFELTIPASKWSENFKYQNRIFIPETELGGIIGGKKSNTSEGIVTVSGRTWRGILDKKVIKPPKGQAYKIVSGELNMILKGLISEAQLTALFSVSEEDTGVMLSNYQFDRYTTLLAGIEKMLRSVGCKPKIRYVQLERGFPGYVSLSADKIIDYSESIELSQDNRLNFTLEEKNDGVNHLICLGQGELTEREVLHLYIDKDGNVSNTQYYTGLEEVEETYDFSSAESEQLLTDGTARLLEVANNRTFTMDVESLNLEADIGDIVGGRDYITGMSLSKPIVSKIYTEENGIKSLEYRLEGNE